MASLTLSTAVMAATGLADLDAGALSVVAAALDARSALALAATCRYARDALLAEASGDVWRRAAEQWGVVGAPVDVAGAPAPSFRAAAVSHQAALGAYGPDGASVSRAWHRLERAIDRIDRSGSLRDTLAPPAAADALAAAAAAGLHPSCLAYSAMHDGQRMADAIADPALPAIRDVLRRAPATLLGGGAVYGQLLAPLLQPLVTARCPSSWLVLAAAQESLSMITRAYGGGEPRVEAARGFAVGARDGIVRPMALDGERVAVAPSRPGVDPPLAAWLVHRAAALESGAYATSRDLFGDGEMARMLLLERPGLPGVEAWPTTEVGAGRGSSGGGGPHSERWADTEGVVIAISAVTTHCAASLVFSYRVRMWLRATAEQGCDPARALTSVTLATREWVTESAAGEVLDRVAGPGVIGEFPTLTAGGPAFVYASRTATPLARARSGAPDSFRGVLRFRGVSVPGAAVAVDARVPALPLVEAADDAVL